MQADHVGGLQELGEQREPYADRVFLVEGEPRDVVVLHPHVEGRRAPRDLLADIAEPDDAERAAGQLVTRVSGESAARQLPAMTSLWKRTTRFSTASMSIIVCSATAMAFAPPLFDTGTPAFRAASTSTRS